jgi:hypothetical protein
MTYCDKTGPDEFALYMNGNQLMYLAEKIRGDNSPQARAISKAIHQEFFQGEDIKPITKKAEPELCSECGGIGKTRVHILEPDEMKFVKCKACKGKRAFLKITTVRYRELSEEFEMQLIPFPGKEVSVNDWPGELID